MTPPASSSRVLLVKDRRDTAEAPGPAVPLRRYRLARLRLEDRQGDSEGRFEHLKRIHD